MCWYVKNLGDAMLATEAIHAIKERFVVAHAQADYPIEMAIFIRHESEHSLHCEVKIYFSPKTSNLAHEVDARPCTIPTPAGMGLLCGIKNSLALLFP